VEVADFPAVEDIAFGQIVERGLIVEDSLFEVVDAILVPLARDDSAGLSVGNGLEEAVGNAPK
jgi:hypothetical protein